MTLHWEFAYGPAQVRQLAAGLAYPMLAINCYDKASGALVFAPTCVIERGGLRIGIIGIASNIVDKTMPPSYSQGVRFTLGNSELPGHIERLRTSEQGRPGGGAVAPRASRRTPSSPPKCRASTR